MTEISEITKVPWFTIGYLVFMTRDNYTEHLLSDIYWTINFLWTSFRSIIHLRQAGRIHLDEICGGGGVVRCGYPAGCFRGQL